MPHSEFVNFLHNTKDMQESLALDQDFSISNDVGVLEISNAIPSSNFDALDDIPLHRSINLKEL